MRNEHVKSIPPRTIRDVWSEQRAPFINPSLSIKTGGSRRGAAGNLGSVQRPQQEEFVFDPSQHVVLDGKGKRPAVKTPQESLFAPGIEIESVGGETLYMTVRLSGVTFTGPFVKSDVDYGPDSAIWSSPVSLDGPSKDCLLLLYVVAREFGVEFVRVQDLRERIFKGQTMEILDIQRGLEIYESPLFNRKCSFPTGYNQGSMRMVANNSSVITASFESRV